MKKCPQCNRTYSDESFSFCLADGALLSATYDPNTTLVIPAASNSAPTTRLENRRVNGERSNQPHHCDRETLLEQAATRLSTPEVQAVREILDRALDLGYEVEWGKGKSCPYKLSYAALAEGSLFQVNSKGELWLTGKAKAYAKLVGEVMGIKVPEYRQWFWSLCFAPSPNLSQRERRGGLPVLTSRRASCFGAAPLSPSRTRLERQSLAP